MSAKRLVHELQVHRVELEMQNHELRRSQNQARENSKKYSELYDFAPTALFTLSPNAMILEVNLAGAELLNQTRAMLLRKSFNVYLTSDAFLFHDFLNDVLSQRGKLHCEIQVRPFGQTQPIVLELQCAAAGTSVRVAAIDVTERRKYAQEREKLLEEAQRACVSAEMASHAKDEFLALISHELRTPLMAMRGWTSILRRQKLAREAELKGLETIERNIAAQDRLIEDLLDVSSITSGKMKLDLRDIELAGVVNEVVESHRAAAGAKNLILELHSPAEPQFMRGDELRIKQIVNNLLTNAIKFTPELGRVSVNLMREGDHATLVVSDNGIGMARESLPHVFDRFRQEENITSRRSKGLGVGLSIVRHLVEAHGGDVQAHSDGRGLGATFTVHLPLAPAQQATRPQSEAPHKLENMPQGIHVLVVEDDEDTRDYLHRLLAEKGAHVTLAGSVAEAMQKLKEDKPDLVLTDIGMPNQDGYQLLTLIRERFSEHIDLPVIAMSAFTRDHDREKAARAGFATFLKKPFEAEQLTKAIQRILPAVHK